MTLMILAGVWAIAFAHIGINGSFKLKGNEARIFGLALIAVAAFGLPHLNDLLRPHMPKLVGGNEALRSAWDQLIGALAIYITGYVMTTVVPKLRIPSVTVSLKRQRT